PGALSPTPSLLLARPHPRPSLLPTRRSSDLTELTTVNRPDPAPDEVVIALTASGVCGTDVHYWQETPHQRGERRSVVPGHEVVRSEEHTSELQSRENLVCRLLLEDKKQEEAQ